MVEAESGPEEGDSKESAEKKKRRRVKRGIISSLCFEENLPDSECTSYCKAKDCHGRAHERCSVEDIVRAKVCKWGGRPTIECVDDSVHDFTFIVTNSIKSLEKECLLCNGDIQENEKLRCVSCTLVVHKECWERFAYQFYTNFEYVYCSLDGLLEKLGEDGLMGALAEINCDYKIEGEDGKVISEVRAYTRAKAIREKMLKTKKKNTKKQKSLQTTEDKLSNFAYKHKCTASSNATTISDSSFREQDPPSEQPKMPREQKVSREQVSSREQDSSSEQPKVSREQTAPSEQLEETTSNEVS